jgi:fluoride exporter
MTAMIRGIILIGIGSCIGGIARYLTQLFVQRHFPSSIPFGTLSVNIFGCFLIGIIYALTGKGNLVSPEMRLFLATGFCGGYTTFSSYAYENISLFQDGEFYYAGLYIIMSNAIGFAAVYLGILFVKIIT